MKHPLVVLNILAFAITGCHDQLRPTLTVTADVTGERSATAGPFVHVYARNESGRSLQLAACDGTDVLPFREQLVDGQWIAAPMSTCARTFQPRDLAPGEVISLGWRNLFGATGTFRFRIPLFRDATASDPSREASAAFTIQ